MAEIATDKKGGNLICDYMEGPVRVKIYDGYVITSPEERAKVDERIARTCWQIVNLARAAGKDI